MDKRIISGKLRIIAMLAVLVCGLMICAVTAYADETSPIPEKVNGKYEIYTADQFVHYMQIATGNAHNYYNGTSWVSVPGDKDASCIFKSDIEFTDETVSYSKMYETEAKAFGGTIDGAGHTIKGLPTQVKNGIVISSGWGYSETSSTMIGHTKGTIKDLTFDVGDVELKGNSGNTGILCGFNYGTISGVVVKANVRYTHSDGMMYAALLCGVNRPAGTIMNCAAIGSIEGRTGISGFINSISGTVKNCYSNVDVTATNNQAYGFTRQATGTTTSVENCYSLGTIMSGSTENPQFGGNDSVKKNCYGPNDTFTAADLGDAYTDDLEGEQAINEGNPVLKYQITGDYPHVEGPDDITVQKIRSVSDTLVVFTSDTAFEYYQPKASDFVVKVETESGVTVDLTPTDLSWGKKSKSITIPSIKFSKTADGKPLTTTTDQKAKVKIITGGEVQAEFDYDIAKSRRWSDYAKEPEVITKNDPRYGDTYSGYYKITTPEELAWLAVKNAGEPGTYEVNVNGNYVMTNDIDLNDTSDPDWSDKDDKMIWDIPIGYVNNGYRVFRGIFDGNGYKVKGMYFDIAVTGAAAGAYGIRSGGLFGRLGGTIRNLIIEDSYVYGNTNGQYGGICGSCDEAAVIENCSFDGVVDTGSYVGGITGYGANRTVIRNCVNYGTVKNGSQYTGGFIGYCYGGSKIENCYNRGNVVGNNSAAFIGFAFTGSENPDVINSYSTGKAVYGASVSTNLDIDNLYILGGSSKASATADIFDEEEGKNGTLLECIGEEFVADDDNINDGYPVLKWQSPLIDAQAKYPEELDFYVDIEEYGMNKELIQDIIDEAKEKIANAKSSAEADAAFNDAKDAIDLIPNDEQVKQSMADELAKLEEQIKEAERRYAFNACDIKLDKASFTYNGKAFEPAVTVTSKDGKVLTVDTDYEVKYEANTEPGLGKVVVSGKVEYSGDREFTFKILPKKNKIISLKKAKKAFTVKWTKDAKATGYQVSYGLKKSFKGAKTIKIAKKASVSKKVTKLKAKKKYFVRVRTYVTSGGQTIYGAWSPVKSVKTK